MVKFYRIERRMQAPVSSKKKSPAPVECPIELENIIKENVKIAPNDTRSYEQILKAKATSEMVSYLHLAHCRINREEDIQHHIQRNEERIYNLLHVLKHGQPK